MDRVTVYSGQIPLETDLLRINKFAMMGLAKFPAAMLGTATVVNGLACVPTAPAGLTVNVNPGEIYSLLNVDGTAYSSLPVDTTHSILKQGILLDAFNLSLPSAWNGRSEHQLFGPGHLPGHGYRPYGTPVLQLQQPDAGVERPEQQRHGAGDNSQGRHRPVGQGWRSGRHRISGHAGG
jgi:hypothetical protein